MEENLTPWQRYKKNLGETRPWDFINPNTEYAHKTVADKRYEICKQCPNLLSTNQCKLCGCFMAAKVKLLHATCPAEKWII